MELKTFTEFQELLGQVQARKSFLGGEIGELSRELSDKTNAFAEAILEGADPEELQAELDALQRKIDLKTREYAALEAATRGKTRAGKLAHAARAVWEEGTDLITKDLRDEWDTQVVELEKAKAMFLTAVAAMGEIKRRADSLTSKLSYGLAEFLPGAGAPHLATGIFEEKHIGIIFPNYNEIKKVYQKGE